MRQWSQCCIHLQFACDGGFLNEHWATSSIQLTTCVNMMIRRDRGEVLIKSIPTVHNPCLYIFEDVQTFAVKEVMLTESSMTVLWVSGCSLQPQEPMQSKIGNSSDKGLVQLSDLVYISLWHLSAQCMHESINAGAPAANAYMALRCAHKLARWYDSSRHNFHGMVTG